MRQNCSLLFLLLFTAVFTTNISAQTPIVVFTDNFDRATFVTNTAYGTPPTTYKFTTGSTSTINTTLVSGSNYRANFNSGTAAQNARYFAPLAPYAAPNTVFSRQLNANPGLVTWTFNMRTSNAATSTTPANGVIAGGMDLCSNAGGNIFSGAPAGYGVVFNSTATGGVSLIKFSSGMNLNTVLITQTTTVSKTNFYSVRVTYDPSNNHWQLFVRDDGNTGFSDPSTGVTLQQGATITDATYTSQVNSNFGAVYTWTAGAGKSFSIDNYQVSVTLPPCGVPGAPSGLSYSNSPTGTSVSFTPPGTAPTGYILVMSSGALIGSPTAGQAVTPGTAVGSNGTIIGAGASGPISSSSLLTPNTNYTMTLFPYNNSGCTGGPVFNTAVPSTVITTCPNSPSITGAGTPTSTTIPAVSWSAPAAGGGVYSSYTYLLNVYTDAGLTVPAPGYPLDATTVTSPYDITGLTSGVTYYYTITAVDGACNSLPSSAGNATTSVVPCSGFPTSGTTSSTATQVTGAAPFTLNLVGASGETGITFQWQSSVCGATWSNLGSMLVSPPFSATETGPTFYRCMVTCANSGLSTTSNSFFVSRVNAAYCNPTSAGGCSGGDGVNAFTLTGACGTSINDAGPMICGAINNDHTSLPAVKLYAGGSFAAAVNSNFDGDDVYVWIDFNNSGTFDASELLVGTTSAPVPALPFFYSFNIPVPAISAGATPGVHRMRVVVNNAQTLTTGCDAFSFGTSVDYLVQIIPNVTLGYNAPVCLPGGLTLTATPAIGCGSTYNWAGPLGFSAASQNANTVSPPAVSGIYSVTINVNGVASCPTAATTNVSVFTAPTISGITAMCVGSTTTLAGAPSGGTWTSSSPGVASIGSASGFATGISIGATSMNYAVSTGCSASLPFAITATPLLFSITGGGSYCIGGTGVHIGLSSSTAGVSYQLLVGGLPARTPLTGTGSALDFGLFTVVGTYTVIANPGTSCATTMPGTATVTVEALPSPFNMTGGGNYCPGGLGVHVGVDGSETGSTYQLYLNGVSTGFSITGSGSALDFGLVTGLGTYNVIATNITGCTNVMTGHDSVALYSAPAPFSVTGGGVYCTGSSAVHIGLSGSSATASYRLSFGGLPFGLSVSGTGSAIDMGAVAPVGTYSVVATNAGTGCTATMIGTATVSINPAPAIFNVTGGGSYCGGGAGVHIGLNGSVPGTNYTLYDGTTLLGSISGTGAALDFGTETSGGTYTVTATLLSTGCSAGMTGSAGVSINSLPTAFNVTGGGNYCTGSVAPHILLSSSTVSATYQLFLGSTPAGGSISGTGTALDFGAQPAPGIYSVVATSSIGCTNTMNGTQSITATPVPSGYLVNGGGNYCSGGAGAHVLLAGSDAGILYQLKNGATNVGPSLSGTGASLDFGALTVAGTYTVTATSIVGSCGAAMPGSAIINVLPLPTAYPMTGGGNYCLGGAGAPVGLNNSDAGVTYQLYNGVAPVAGGVAGSGSPIDFGLQTAAGTYSVSATNTTTGCFSTMTGTETVAIASLPAAFAVTGGGNICPSGPGVHIGLSGSATGIGYQLYNGTIPVGIAMPGTGSAVDFGAQSATGLYSVIATNGTSSCSSNMTGSVTVGTNPLPVVHTVTGGGSFYCVGGIGVHVGLDGSDIGNSYQLMRGAFVAGAAVAGTGAALDFGLETTAGPYTVVATGTGTGCSAPMAGGASVEVSGQPIVYVITGGGNYCAGDAGVHLGLNGSEAGIIYQLYNGTSSSGSPLAGTGAALDFGIRSATGTYTISATNTATGCSVDMAGTAAVGVAAMPLVYTIAGGGSYCAGGTGLHITLGWSDAGVNYALYRAGVATGTILPGTGAPLDFGLQTAGSYTIVGTTGVTTCSNIMNGNAIIVANTLPDTFTVTGGGSYCTGGAGVHIMLGNSVSGISYQLYYGGTASGAALSGSGSSIDFGLRTAAGSYTVIARNVATGCTQNMNATATVATIPLPASFTAAGGGSYCISGPGVHITLSGSVSSVAYQLYDSTTAEGAPVYGTGSSLDFGLQSATGTYTVIATDLTTTCSATMPGAPVVSTIPLPGVFTVTGGGISCSGSAGVHVGITGSATGVSYLLNRDGVSTGASLPGSGGVLDFGLQTSAGSYTVTAVNTGGCTAAMTGTATVTAGALPGLFSVSGSSNTGYCVGGPGIIIYLGGSDPGVSYHLYRGASPTGISLPGTGGALIFGAQTLAGSYNIVATNTATGCTRIMNGSVSVYTNPLPAAFNVTGGGGICTSGPGAHISITGSATGVTYQVYRLGAAIGLSVSGTGAAIDLGAQTLSGSYTVLATDVITGCTKTMVGSAGISINPSPAVYTITGGGSFCAGGTGVHAGLSGSATGVSYQLYSGSSLSGAALAGTGSAIDFGLKTASGLYTVIATSTGSGCTANMTGSVTISSLSLPAPHAITGGGAYCAGGPGVNIGISGSGAGISYKLYNGSVPVGSAIPGSGLSLDFGPQTGAGTYSVIAVDPLTTCTATMPGTTAITINPLPDVYPVTGGGNYCEGGTGVHIGIAASAPGISYSLYRGASLLGAVAGSGTPLDFGAQTAAGAYTVRAADVSTACTSLMSGIASVGITPSVVPTVSFSTGSGDTLCLGNTTTFTASGVNGGTSPSFSWTVNGIPVGVSAAYTYIPVDGDVVGVNMASTAACASPATASYNAAVTVWEKHFPAVSVSADPGIEVCQGTPVTFSATPSYGGTAPSYQWLNGTTPIGGGPSLSIVPAAGDVITCKLTSNYVCKLAPSATSAPDVIVIDTAGTPVVTIAAYPGLNIVSGQLLTFDASVTKGGPAPVYSWAVNGVVVPGAVLPTYGASDFKDGDVVTCSVTSSGGCAGITGSKSVTVSVNTVGVRTVGGPVTDVHIVPNPSNGSFIIRGTFDANEVAVSVTNMLGQAVYQGVVNTNNGTLETQVELNNVAAGSYVLTLRSDGQDRVFHIVVNK